jgi:hypothetical protein
MSYTIKQLQDHFRRIYSIIGFISRAAGGRGGMDMGWPSPNAYYGQSHDLGIILGEYYGMPSGVSTPLGWLKIDTPCIVDESWRPKAKEALGLEPLYGEWRERNGESVFSPVWTTGPMGGEMGPGWALLRDTDGNTLDKPETPIEGWFMSPVTEMRYTYEESKAIWDEHIAPIFS